MAYIVLYFISIFMYIITIPLLIISIITKNKCINKNNLKISIFMLIYLISELFLIDKLVDIGFEFVLILVFSLISSIILIISIIINKKKLSKNIDGQSNYFIKHYSKLFIFPVVLIIAIVFLYELFIINNADLIMVYRERKILNVNTTQIALNQKYGKKFSINLNLIKLDKLNVSILNYEVEENQLKKDLIINSYDDPYLVKIDKNIIEKVLYDDNYTKNQEVVEFYKNDKTTILKADITTIVGTNYYIVKHYLWSKEHYGELLGEAIYYNDKFVADLNVTGDLEEVYILK